MVQEARQAEAPDRKPQGQEEEERSTPMPCPALPCPRTLNLVLHVPNHDQASLPSTQCEAEWTFYGYTLIFHSFLSIQ
ncbi:hypothetical protein E2C01_087744 [Portunus trituberculatus]|uniref:Uncharacterized protein n=1 Tax=Portunus trituberculatus TaxID=210409 RepID=A0A5B7JE70_PORTR|nr:hypothetical protein [Portunus trituberculatus]